MLVGSHNLSKAAWGALQVTEHPADVDVDHISGVSRILATFLSVPSCLSVPS